MGFLESMIQEPEGNSIMLKQLFRKTGLSYLLIGFWSLSSTIATVLDLQPVQFLEQQVQTLFFVLRGPISPPTDIVILAIDEQSLSAAETYRDDPKKQQIVAWMQTWPWQRAAYAEALERLMAAEARTVAFDILFDLPSGYGEADDRRLQAALETHAERVVLATAYFDSLGPQGTTTEPFGPHPSLQTNSMALGLVNYPPPEVDGRVHRLGNAYREEVLRPLNLEMVLSLPEIALQLAEIDYPRPRGSGIFFYGASGAFTRIPFWQVLAPDWWKLHLESQTFAGKIVLVGTTAETTTSSDFHRTPFSPRMPGVELHANAIATLLEGKSIAEAFPDPWFQGLFVFFGTSMAGAALICLAKRPLLQLFVGTGCAFAWSSFSYLVFTYGQLIVPMVPMTGAIALSGLSCFVISAVSAQLEKFRLRQTLERYVAVPVVQEILKQPADFHALLKGHQLQAAVLFADIRGFTRLSYTLPPEQLIEQLNAYFNAMVEAIINVGGTVDKFIGDAIMAEFGFPLSQGKKNDAMNAIRAALGMRRALAQLRQQFIQADQVPLFNGIGLSFGEVIAGDIGSLRRREYGVIGDTVNIASRVESLTKKFQVDILLADSLYQLVAEEVDAIDLGEHQLRGREEQTVKLYSLIGLKGEDRGLYDCVQEDLQQHLGEGHS